jgi:hypothetical protein
MILKTHVGKSTVTGTFFVYEDEGLAKKHINPTIFSRLEKAKAKLDEEVAAEPAKEVAAEPAKEVAAEPAKEVAAEAAAETTKEEKSE